MVANLEQLFPCLIGGTGRRARFKIAFPREYLFESGMGRQVFTINSCNQYLILKKDSFFECLYLANCLLLRSNQGNPDYQH